MSETSKEFDDIAAGSSAMMESAAVEGEEYYNPEEAEWSQKIDPGKLCRICANTNDYLIPIFDGEGLEHELGRKIEKHLPIKVTEADTLPLQVCYPCASTLIAWHDLVINCVEADKKLREMETVDDDDDDDKGAEMFESPSLDSEMVDEVQPGTSEPQNQPPEKPTVKKVALNKDRKSKLKVVLVKGSGQKTTSKTQAAKAMELGKSNEVASQDAASERCQQLPLTSFKDYHRAHNEMRNIPQSRITNSSLSDNNGAVKIETSDSEDTWLTCDYCGHISSGKAELVTHITSLHSGSMGDLVCNTENNSTVEIKQQNSDSRDSIEGEIHKANINKLGSKSKEKNYSELKHVNEDKRSKTPHNAQIRKIRSFSCDNCSKTFTRKLDLQNHLKLHVYLDSLHSPSVVKAPATIKETSDTSDASNSNRVGNTEVHDYPCNVCGRVLLRKCDWSRHVKTHTKKSIPIHDMSDPEASPHASDKDIAENSVETDNDLKDIKDVIKTEEMETGFTCNVCGEELSTRADLEDHLLTHDNIAQRNPNRRRISCGILTDNTYSCGECAKSFTRKFDLKRHAKLHTPERINKVSSLRRRISKEVFCDAKVVIDGRTLYKCEHCSKHLVTRYSYIRHLRIHTGEKPCTCHVCGKQFRTSALLNRHVRDVHEGIKEHPCDICGRKFKNKRAMMDHRTIHTGERSCVCHLCGKAFKTKACLYIHNLFHQDVFPHKCTHCDKAFRRRQQLEVHLLLHTGEKPHCCQMCGKCFRLRKTLKRHILTHTTEKPYECQICGQLFAQERYLKNHGKIHGIRIASKNTVVDSGIASKNSIVDSDLSKIVK